MTRLDEIDDPILQVLGSEEQAQLARYLAHAGEDGVTTVNRLEAETGDIGKLLGVTSDLPDHRVAEFLQTPNNHRLVSDLNGAQLRDAIELPPGERQALRALAYHGDDIRHVESDLPASELLRISQKTDLQKVEVVVRASNGDVLYLESRHINHAYERHVRGEEALYREKTSFFPAGQKVEIEVDGTTRSKTMPNKMSVDRETIKKMAYDGIEQGTVGGDGHITHRVQMSGVDEVTLHRHGDSIESVYPSQGSDYWIWKNEQEQFVHVSQTSPNPKIAGPSMSQPAGASIQYGGQHAIHS